MECVPLDVLRPQKKAKSILWKKKQFQPHNITTGNYKSTLKSISGENP